MSAENTPSNVNWGVIQNYDNKNAVRYGQVNMTVCECAQACLAKTGCSGFDWYPAGHHTWCWLGTDCPLVAPTLEPDVTNQHYVPLNMVYCYPSVNWAGTP